MTIEAFLFITSKIHSISVKFLPLIHSIYSLYIKILITNQIQLVSLQIQIFYYPYSNSQILSFFILMENTSFLFFILIIGLISQIPLYSYYYYRIFCFLYHLLYQNCQIWPMNFINFICYLQVIQIFEIFSFCQFFLYTYFNVYNLIQK